VKNTIWVSATDVSGNSTDPLAFNLEIYTNFPIGETTDDIKVD